MENQRKKSKKSNDQDSEEDFLFNWSSPPNESLDDEDIDNSDEDIDERIHPRLPRPHNLSTPPLPPLPPVPPLPQDIEISKSEKVIGIRGLDSRLYKDISRIAKRNGISVAELINRVLARYRYTSIGENGNTISNIDSLELDEEELRNLGDEEINIIGVKNLLLGPDITRDTFKKIQKIEHIERIWVPSHLYLHLVKKAKDCSKIEKYRGDRLPRVVQKSFDSDVHLTRSFFEYFLDTEQMVDLTVYGELKIDEDVSLDDFKNVIYHLRVDHDIQAPRHLIGILFAKSQCYGEIEEIED
ncbi:MAG: hypothetical protein ACFFB2_12785 [Promethearchaeota archaeon]